MSGDAVTYDIEVPPASTGALRLAADYRNISVDGAAWNGQGDKALAPGKHRIAFNFTPASRAQKAEHSINARTP